MTQAHGGPVYGPTFTPSSGSDFGATTVSGPARPEADSSATTTSVPIVSEPVNPYASQTPAAPTPPPGAPAEGAKAGFRGRVRGPRRARLQLRHINPWTVLKFSCVLSIALFFVWLIVIGVLFGVLDATGVIDRINSAVTTINGNGSNAPVTAGLVFGGAAIIGVINIVLFIALSTIGSVIYNLCADLVGGVELTLSEG